MPRRTESSGSFPRPPIVPLVDDDHAPVSQPEVRTGAPAEVVAELLHGLEAARASVEMARAEALVSTEKELVRLALAIAERVVGRELSTDPRLIAAWAREGIEALGATDVVKCVVSPKVAEALSKVGPWAPDGVCPEVVVDPRLPASACEIRGRYGRVDAGLEARLDAVTRALDEEGA